MGLDISVVKNIKKIDINDEEAIENHTFMAFVIDDAWKHKIKNLEDGAYYNGDYCDASVSYAYSSHSYFRSRLCELVLNVPVSKFYECDLKEGMPFYELVDFADNEGCLDWEVSELLYNNFVEFYDKAKEKLTDNWDLNNYENWMEVFKEASENKGVVVFS